MAQSFLKSFLGRSHDHQVEDAQYTRFPRRPTPVTSEARDTNFDERTTRASTRVKFVPREVIKTHVVNGSNEAADAIPVSILHRALAGRKMSDGA